MNHKALVSIIIPVYNAEEYLEENIKSVLNQSYSNIEAIYVCDGCTDNSAQILEKYENDNRVKVIKRKNNIGAAQSRNQGAKIATGDWLIFWDADDVAANEAIEKLYEGAISNDAEMSICDYGNMSEETIHTKGMIFEFLEKKIEKYPVFENQEKIIDFSTMLVCNAPFNKLISRRLYEIEAVKFQNLENCNDVYFSAATFLNARRVTYVDKKLYWYRSNNDRNISKKRISVDSDILEAIEAVRKLMGKLNYSLLLFKKYAYTEIMDYRGTTIFRKILNEYSEKYRNIWNLKLDSEYLYSVDNIERFKGKKVAIYGAGKVGKDYYKRLSSIANVSGWYDTNFSDETVKNIREIKGAELDYLVIATKSDFYANQMEEMALEYGVEERKIIKEYPIHVYDE